jgi:hypothetical protein
MIVGFRYLDTIDLLVNSFPHVVPRSGVLRP